RTPAPPGAALAAAPTATGPSRGMGPMGYVGSSMVVDCHIEVGCCHTGGMPISIHSFCLSSRRAVARLHGDGRIEYRTDPNWFTPYSRRESVEWTEAEQSLAAV
ncbi:MAG: fumarate hydratase, partial [Rhodospirillaceae bacterium]|nr:fumarate hydratase [Rhodospirillaceae bacterium]